MPVEDAGCIESVAEKDGGNSHHHHHHGYHKLFHFFRFRRKNSKAQNQDTSDEHGPEQRRERLERDMRTNWEELPATLKRKKERMSQAVLAEFHSEQESSAGSAEPVPDNGDHQASSNGGSPNCEESRTQNGTRLGKVPDCGNGASGIEGEVTGKVNGEGRTELAGVRNSSPVEQSPIGESNKAVNNVAAGSHRQNVGTNEDQAVHRARTPDDQKTVNGGECVNGSSDRPVNNRLSLDKHVAESTVAADITRESDSARENKGSEVTGVKEVGHVKLNGVVKNSGSDDGSEDHRRKTATSSSDFGGSKTDEGRNGLNQQNGVVEDSSRPEQKKLDGAALLEQEQLSLRELERLRHNLHMALNTATDLDSEQRHVVELLRRAVSSEDSLLMDTSSSSAGSSRSSLSDQSPSGQQHTDSGTDVTEPGYEDVGRSSSITTATAAAAAAVEAYYDAIVRQSDEEPPLPLVIIPKATTRDCSSLEERRRRQAEETYDRPRPSRWKRQLTDSPRPGCSMDTIVEEDEKLSVREILRRFEQLGAANGPQIGPEEKSATLKQIQETLRCLEEKVRHYEQVDREQQQQQPQQQLHQKHQQPILPTLDSYHHQQSQQQQSNHHHHHQQQLQQQQHSPPQHGGPRRAVSPPPAHSHHLDGWTGRPQHVGNVLSNAHELSQQQHSLPSQHDGKHSLLQFAMLHFRQSPEKFEMLKAADGSISGSLKVIESLKSKKNKSKKGNKENEWTWKEQVDLVKFSSSPIEQSLLRLESVELNDLAIECFISIMRYMGDLPMPPDVTEVKCVYTILMHCHKHEQLRDEVYCQLMKQTTNNKSPRPDSCQRGWRLFSIVAAYFVCSDVLRPYLFKYLETAAYDKRRAYHGTATVCLHNLRKTFKYGGRKNVPSVEEITAISAGRNSKRQIYRLPGGTERVVNTKCTTVVQDVIEEMCAMINVQSPAEMDEFSLYCIVEGDTFTMPLAREEYVLDVTTELHKNQQVFYLIFCRSVWHFPLRLDSQLYIEVVFNQIAPDYLEGLLLVMPGEQLEQDVIYDIAKMAALLHRAADMTHLPTMKETKFLLPKPALTVRDVKPAQWVNMVQGNWHEVQGLTTIQAKAQVLDILSKWPLFGSSFFAVKRVSDPKERSEHILALNRHGVHFIDLVTHETLIHYPFSEVISTRKVKSEDGTLFLDMKCGNLMQQRITRLQTDQAHEISRLIRQYITMEQRLRHS